MSFIEDQNKQVAGKRCNEQDGNGGLKKKKKTDKEADATRADSEDGWNILEVITQVTVSTHCHVHKQKQEDMPCCIQSVFRGDREVVLMESDGNLLKAGSDKTKETIDVDFTGTDPDDPAAEFHMVRSIAKEANTLRYRFGDHNYYLAVDTDPDKAGQVKLCRSVNLPTDDKYYFHIKRIGPECEAAFAFKTLKTNKYLHCSNDGKVFLEEVKHPANEECKDRRTWFRCMRSPQIQDQFVRYEKTDVAFGIKCLQSTTVMETKTTSESTSPGEGNSEDAQKKNSEDPEVGNSEDPGKKKCDGPRREDSKDPEGEANHENMKEGQPGELEDENLEDPSTENSNDLGETENSDEKNTPE